MSEDPEPYGNRPADLHTWTLRLADGAEVTLDAPSIRKAIELCQRRQLVRKIGTRAEIIAAERADRPDSAAQLRLAARRLRNALRMIEAHPADTGAAIHALRMKAQAAIDMTAAATGSL